MTTLRKFLAASCAAFVLTVAAVAADPTGTWKWTTEGRNGPMEATAKLELKDGALSGTISGRMGDAPIGEASFKDNLERDTITGTIERPSREGGTTKVDWKATRQK
jgi:hypothetical protein